MRALFLVLPLLFAGIAGASTCEDLLTSLWGKIAAEPYVELPSLDSQPGPGLRQIFFSGIGGSFSSPTDEIQPTRTKIIHKFGSAVQIAFEADALSEYTGIFESGAIGIARMSLALPFKPGGAFVPGMALKFFVEGKPSVNIVVMERLEGQGSDTNYFAKTFTNILPDPESASTKFGTWAFEGFVENAIRLNVDHLAAVRADGTAVAKPKTPFQLLFVPVKGLSTDSSAVDFRNELAKIPAGTVLYDVYAQEDGFIDSRIPRIGRIVTKSKFVASAFGDEKLYFQHAGTELKSGYVLRWLHLIK